MRLGQMDKKEVIAFRKDIAPGVTDVLAERVKGEGTIEGFSVRFYTGQQQALQVEVFVEHKGHMRENLLTFPSSGKTYLDGDDDYFNFDVSIPVRNDDYIKVRVKNVDDTYTYSLVVDVVVDYLGGVKRVI